MTILDFYAYGHAHTYIFAAIGVAWPAASVNGFFPKVPVRDANGVPVLNKRGEPKTVRPSQWLDSHRPVHQLIWAPGQPLLIRNRLVAEGGWISRPKATTLNLYRPPTLEHGDAGKASQWVDHVHKVYPDDAGHIIAWLAQRVQHPEVKINHALLLGGMQGIGKDTLIEPVKRAIGPWNCREVSPQQLMGAFSGFIKTVILRVSEARDLGDTNRYKFYDHLKTYTAAPPDVIRMNEKYLPEQDVFNCMGVILTTNYKTDGIYLPPDDRRHYVAWSELSPGDFAEDYWNSLWHWYDNGGAGDVAAYLTALDISGFDPKAPPPKTEAFWSIVGANRPPEEDQLADVLDALGNPDAVTLVQIQETATGNFQQWLLDNKNNRAIPHRMDACDYVPCHNPDEKSGRWRVQNKRCPIYTKRALSLHERLAAARALIQSSEKS